MLYAASDAINLFYKIIGNASTLLIEEFNKNTQKQQQIALNIKEFYRFLIKKKIKTEKEILIAFDNYEWISLAKDEIEFIKKFFQNNFLINNKDNYFLNENNVYEELNRIYDKALENTFILDKKTIDWSKTVRIVESKFLIWIRAKSLKQDKELKEKLLSILDNLNQNEEVNYKTKYNTLMNSLEEFRRFIFLFEENKIDKNDENVQTYNKYIKYLSELAFTNNLDLNQYLNFELIYTEILNLSDDSTIWDFDYTLNLLLRVYYATLLNLIISSSTLGVWSAKAEMLRSNGGWKIDLKKDSVRNLYIGLTQSKENIQTLIHHSTTKLNKNSIQIAKILVQKLLLIIKNEEIKYEIVNLYFEILDKLIKYHETGISEKFLVHPGEALSNFDIKSADALLNFDNIDGIIKAMKNLNNLNQNFKYNDFLKTINFIKEISKINMF